MSGAARPGRVAEEFREILAEEIPRLKDPRVGFVTVTRVEVSADLRKATVFYTVLGQNRDHNRTRAGLESARAHLRSLLGQRAPAAAGLGVGARRDAVGGRAGGFSAGPRRNGLPGHGLARAAGRAG